MRRPNKKLEYGLYKDYIPSLEDIVLLKIFEISRFYPKKKIKKSILFSVFSNLKLGKKVMNKVLLNLHKMNLIKIKAGFIELKAKPTLEEKRIKGKMVCPICKTTEFVVYLNPYNTKFFNENVEIVCPKCQIGHITVFGKIMKTNWIKEMYEIGDEND